MIGFIRRRSVSDSCSSAVRSSWLKEKGENVLSVTGVLHYCRGAGRMSDGFICRRVDNKQHRKYVLP